MTQISLLRPSHAEPAATTKPTIDPPDHDAQGTLWTRMSQWHSNAQAVEPTIDSLDHTTASGATTGPTAAGAVMNTAATASAMTMSPNV